MTAAALAACALALVAAGCTTAPAWERLPASPLRLTAAPGKTVEQCFALAAGERVEYQFEATGALDFNLHTHRGGEVVMPVKIPQIREQAGTFASPRREEYCMMWSNQSAVPVRISGEWRRLR